MSLKAQISNRNEVDEQLDKDEEEENEIIDFDQLLFYDQNTNAQMYEPGMQLDADDLQNYMTLERYQVQAQILSLQEKVEGEKLQRIQDAELKKAGINRFNGRAQQMTYEQIKHGQELIKMYDPVTQTYILKQYQGTAGQMEYQSENFGGRLNLITDPVERAKLLARFNASSQQMETQGGQQGQNLTKVWDPESQTYVMKPYKNDVDVIGVQTDKYGTRLTKAFDPLQKDQSISQYNANIEQLEFFQDQDGQILINVWDHQTQAYALKPLVGNANTMKAEIDQFGNSLSQVFDPSQSRQTMGRYNAGAEQQTLNNDHVGQKLTKVWDPLTQTYILNPMQGSQNLMGVQSDKYGNNLNQVLDYEQQGKQMGRFNTESQKMEYEEQNGLVMVKVWDPLSQTYQLKQQQENPGTMNLQVDNQGRPLNQIFDPETQSYKLKPMQQDQESMDLQKDKYGNSLKQVYDPKQGNQQLNHYNQKSQLSEYEQNNTGGQNMIKVWDAQNQSFVLKQQDQNIIQQNLITNNPGKLLNQIIDPLDVSKHLGRFNGQIHQTQQNNNELGLQLMMVDDFEEDVETNIAKHQGRAINNNIGDQQGQNLNQIINDNHRDKNQINSFKANQYNDQLQQGGIPLKPINDVVKLNDLTNHIKQDSKNILNQQTQDQKGQSLNRIQEDEFNQQKQNNLGSARVMMTDLAEDSNGQNLQRLNDTDNVKKLTIQRNNSKNKIYTSDSEGEQLMKVDDYQQGNHRFKPEHKSDQYDSMIQNKESNVQKIQNKSLTQNQIKNHIPDQYAVVLTSPDGDQLIAINDDNVNEKNKNLTSKTERILAPLKPPRGKQLAKINPLDDNKNNKEKESQPVLIQGFNSNQTLDLEPLSDQFNKQNNLNLGSSKKIEHNLLKRKSSGNISISIVPKQQMSDNNNQSPIINNNPIFEFEVWSINKIINKYQHFLVDQQVQFPQYPDQYLDLANYDRLKDYKDSQFEKIKYAGFTKNNLPYGRGILMRYPTGAIYDGIWENGLFVWGVVLELNPNDDLTRYIGPYNQEFQRKHGQGLLEWYDLSKNKFHLKEYHDGQFVYGQIRDHGIRTYENGDVYDGEWKNNVREGFGKLQYKLDDERYEGFFSNGKFCGLGSYFHKDGLKEVGQYKDGKSIDEHKVYDQQDQFIKTVIYGKKGK